VRVNTLLVESLNVPQIALFLILKMEPTRFFKKQNGFIPLPLVEPFFLAFLLSGEHFFQSLFIYVITLFIIEIEWIALLLLYM